jgi:hypothetical protein
MSVISATSEAVVEGLWLEASPDKVTLRPYLKNKLTGDVAQVVEHLQMQGPEFNPQCHKEEERGGRGGGSITCKVVWYLN